MKKYLKKNNKNKFKIINYKNIYKINVYKTNMHIYTYIVDYKKYNIITSSSSNNKNILKKINYYINLSINIKINFLKSILVGYDIAKKALKFGIKKITFDKLKYNYHGRVKILVYSIKKYSNLLF